MASSSTQAQIGQAQPAPRAPQFQEQGNHVAVTNSVMASDERIPSMISDLELANGSLILGIRINTVLSHMSRRLHARSVEAQELVEQVTALRQKVSALKQEKKQFKRKEKQWKEQRDALEQKLALYQDCVKTRGASIKKEAEVDGGKCTWLSLSTHVNSNTSHPSGQEIVE